VWRLKLTKEIDGSLVGVGQSIRLSVDGGRTEIESLENGRPVPIGGMETVMGRDVEGVPLSCATTRQ
jgi:hypothetical protein